VTVVLDFGSGWRRKWLRRLVVVRQKTQLQRKLFSVFLPVAREGPFRFIDTFVRDFEGNRLVGLTREQEVLVFAIMRFDALFVRRHETVSGLCVHCFFVIDLKKEALDAGVGVSLLRHLVPRAPEFDCTSHFDVGFGGWHNRGVFRFFRRPSGEVRLVSLSLRVGEVVAFVVVQRQTQLALECSEVVFHEVRVFRNIDRFQSQFPKAFPAILILCRLRHHGPCPGLGARPILEIHSGVEAMSPSRSLRLSN